MSENWTAAVGDMLRSILLFLPKALAFIVILVVGWFLAKAVRKLVDRILERVGFDRVVERGGVKAALARSRYDASDLVAKLVFYAILLLTLQLAFGIWGPNPVSALIALVVAWLPRAFVAILIIVVAAAIARAVKDVIGSALGGLSYGRTLANVASVFILGLGVIAALNQIGVATTVTTPVLIAVLATIAGILVIGVGGGLVRPMQARWESWLDRAERESRVIAEQARAYAEAQPAQPVGPARPEPVTYPATTSTYVSGSASDATQPVPPPAAEPPTPPSSAPSSPATSGPSASTDSAAPSPAAPVSEPASRALLDEETMVIPSVQPRTQEGESRTQEP